MNETYCNFQAFQASYRSVHGYLSLLVCVFGSIANILNICVLTTKEMRIPTNFILTGLACSDLLVMLEYIPFTFKYLHPEELRTPKYFSYPWAAYMYFHALFTQVCHFNSCCLTVLLAVWRYIALNHLQMSKIWCSNSRTKWAIFVSGLLCSFVCTPLFLGLNITRRQKFMYDNGTLIDDEAIRGKLKNYTANLTSRTLYVLALDHDYQNISFFMYSVVLKLLPCVLLTVLSILLIQSLLNAKKRWKHLSNSSGAALVKTSDQNRRNEEKERQADRTTRMLLAVLLLFLIPEFPQAAMGLLSAFLGYQFYNECYNTLGDLWDITALVNSSINFILYCSMSAQFRTAFKEIFLFNKIQDILRRRRHGRRKARSQSQVDGTPPTGRTDIEICTALNGNQGDNDERGGGKTRQQVTVIGADGSARSPRDSVAV